jgi:hypothetical protein
MGRKSKTIEFLETLSDLLEAKGDALASTLGKQPANMSAYLSGNKKPGNSVLLTSVRHAFEWQVVAICEVQPIKGHASRLPATPGIYCLYDSSGSAIYVGQAKSLKAEVAQTLNRKTNFPVRLGPKLAKKEKRKYREVATYLSAYDVPSLRMRHNLEALLLRAFPKQSHNNKMGNFR